MSVGHARRFAPATERNRVPIADTLRRVLPPSGVVLEIASGTGEHAVYFADRFPNLVWQPTDPEPSLRASIQSWTAHAGATNVLPPLDLDARADVWSVSNPRAVVCINMIHIAPFAACEGLFRGASRCLDAGAPLFLYGPFRIDGVHTSKSNAEFDENLKARDPSHGVRDLDDVDRVASMWGFVLEERIAMPANNQSVIWRRR